MSEPNNLDLLKSELKKYVSSGQYDIDISDKMSMAEIVANKLIGNPLAIIILDIDETMVSTYSIMQKYDFGWTEAALEESFLSINLPAIPAVKRFYTIFKNPDYQCKIKVLTSRRHKYFNNIKQLLMNAGYLEPDIICRPDDDTGTIQNFKIKQRDILTTGGYYVALNIGDQYSDLQDGLASPQKIKLPNPFYFVDGNQV